MSDLPTKPGPYYWRESDGGEWEIAQINRCMDVYFVGCDMHYGLKKTGGEWLPIPTAEELVELQSAKKMVDEGVEAWAVFTQTTHRMVVSWQAKGESQEMCDDMNRMSFKHRYTCEPVTIIRKAKR